jgi:transcriptional regulator with XRE-family HTH domain
MAVRSPDFVVVIQPSNESTGFEPVESGLCAREPIPSRSHSSLEYVERTRRRGKSGAGKPERRRSSHPVEVPSVDRPVHRGTRRGLRSLQQIGEETRDARIQAAMSQAVLGKAVGLSQPQISRMERAQLRNLSVLDASRTASVLGLDLVVRLYPGGTPLRDAAQADRLRRILKHVRAPLTYRIDVPLPQRPNQPMEQRRGTRCSTAMRGEPGSKWRCGFGMRRRRSGVTR